MSHHTKCSKKLYLAAVAAVASTMLVTGVTADPVVRETFTGYNPIYALGYDAAYNTTGGQGTGLGTGFSGIWIDDPADQALRWFPTAAGLTYTGLQASGGAAKCIGAPSGKTTSVARDFSYTPPQINGATQLYVGFLAQSTGGDLRVDLWLNSNASTYVSLDLGTIAGTVSQVDGAGSASVQQPLGQPNNTGVNMILIRVTDRTSSSDGLPGDIAYYDKLEVWLNPNLYNLGAPSAVLSGNFCKNAAGGSIQLLKLALKGYVGPIDKDVTFDEFFMTTNLNDVLVPLCADSDSDGICNAVDNCVAIANPDQNDADNDGIGSACDACPLDAANDADGDTICGDVDACPLDALNDSDDDGLCDNDDACPLDAANDADSDGDCGNVDNCPTTANADQADSDNDGVGNACDICVGSDNIDSDSDGLCDASDACPLDAANDADGDTICGDVDACPLDAVNDADGDTICGDVDACPLDAANDADGDGDCGNVDNCPTTANADQADYDADTVGDACDNCDGVANLSQTNGDCDTLGDACDNCPGDTNEDQANNDGDSQGDVCDTDDDNDGVTDDADNCPIVANNSQSDFDGNGVGDACEQDADGDLVGDSNDSCPNTPAGVLVDFDGCSGAQNVAYACPCVKVPAYKNHGAYVSCVAQSAEAQLNAGLITSAQKDAIVSAAGKDNCGKKK